MNCGSVVDLPYCCLSRKGGSQSPYIIMKQKAPPPQETCEGDVSCSAKPDRYETCGFEEMGLMICSELPKLILTLLIAHIK